MALAGGSTPTSKTAKTTLFFCDGRSYGLADKRRRD
jgi:hypothetical protein